MYSLPNKEEKSNLHARPLAQFSHHTALQSCRSPSTARESFKHCSHSGHLRLRAILTCIPHFLAHKVNGHVAAQSYPRKLPILKKERRLTSRAQRLQEHDIHYCAHTPRNAVYTHSRPKRLRRCSNQGFSGNHTSTCLQGQEKCR